MDNKICFLICPIGTEGSETRKNSDAVFDYILSPIMKQKGYELIRADKIIQTDIITESIIKHIKNDSLVIADVSEANPNVYFELGYRTALNKPIIQIAKEGTKLPFDVSIKRTFFYDKSDLSKVENFKTLLLTLIDDIEAKVSEDKQQQQSNNSNNFSEELAKMFLKDMLFNPNQSEAQKLDTLKKLNDFTKNP